jgi:hypothetical protein
MEAYTRKWSEVDISCSHEQMEKRMTENIQQISSSFCTKASVATGVADTFEQNFYSQMPRSDADSVEEIHQLRVNSKPHYQRKFIYFLSPVFSKSKKKLSVLLKQTQKTTKGAPNTL